MKYHSVVACILSIAAFAASAPGIAVLPTSTSTDIATPTSTASSSSTPTADNAGSGPTGDYQTWSKTEYTATFDDLDRLTDNVAVEEVGPYDGLDYEGIFLFQVGVEGTVPAGVTPESYPNTGGYGSITVASTGQPYITTQYSGSAVALFDFKSFYFGCRVATVQGVASVPESCTVTVTGYKSSVEVAKQSFHFEVQTLATLAPMIKAELSKDFKGIDTATFYTDNYGFGDEAGATLLDSLSYTVFSCD